MAERRSVPLGCLDCGLFRLAFLEQANRPVTGTGTAMYEVLRSNET